MITDASFDIKGLPRVYGVQLSARPTDRTTHTVHLRSKHGGRTRRVACGSHSRVGLLVAAHLLGTTLDELASWPSRGLPGWWERETPWGLVEMRHNDGSPCRQPCPRGA